MTRGERQAGTPRAGWTGFKQALLVGKIRSDARSRGARGGIDHKASQSWPKEARRARRFARAGCLMQAGNTNKHNSPRVSKQAACVGVAGREFAGRGRRRSSRRLNDRYRLCCCSM